MRKGGALPPIQTDMRKSVRDTTYMETVFPAEFKEHPDDADFFPDFAKMDIPENLGETLIEALSNSGIPETDAIGTSVEGTTGLQTGLVLKQFKQEEDMENKDLLKGMENASAYREMFLTRKMTGARRQTYIDESLYETLTGILPVIAPGISVPTFVNNVLAEHMEKYRDIIKNPQESTGKPELFAGTAKKSSFFCRITTETSHGISQMLTLFQQCFIKV